MHSTTPRRKVIHGSRAQRAHGVKATRQNLQGLRRPVYAPLPIGFARRLAVDHSRPPWTIIVVPATSNPSSRCSHATTHAFVSAFRCSKFADRISASLINHRLPFLFSLAAGLILRTGQTAVHCSYFADGGTMSKFCDTGIEGCVPGCADDKGRPNWCDSSANVLDRGANIYNCAFRPQDTAKMLMHHHAFAWGYNEIVIDTAKWVKNLPRTLEAMYFAKGDSDGEAQARAVHSRFMAAYPGATVPLFSMDLKADHPFKLA